MTDIVNPLHYFEPVIRTKSLLCHCRVLHLIVRKFALGGELLNNEVKNDQPFHFRGLHEKKIDVDETLQPRSPSPPILAQRRSNRSICGTLSRVTNKSSVSYLRTQQKQTARFLSRSLIEAEQAAETAHNLCLADVLAVLLLNSYLQKSWFTAWIDHNILWWIKNVMDPTEKLERLPLLLSELISKVDHQVRSSSVPHKRYLTCVQMGQKSPCSRIVCLYRW